MESYKVFILKCEETRAGPAPLPDPAGSHSPTSSNNSHDRVRIVENFYVR